MNRLVKRLAWWAARRYAVKKMKLLTQSIQWANILGFAAQFFQVLPPALQGNKYVIAAQGLIGILLPSLGGVGHQIVYGKPPDA